MHFQKKPGRNNRPDAFIIAEMGGVVPIPRAISMADDNLREAIKSMMIESLMLKVSKEEIRDDLPLFGPEGLGLDSIDALELVVGLEKHFGVSVPNSETARQALATVNSIHDYIVANRKA
jgi:acyl carrier protein